MLLDVGIQNGVVDVLSATIMRTSNGPMAPVVKWCNTNTAAGCTLQRFVLDWYACTYATLGACLEQEKDNLPLTFFRDLVIRVSNAPETKVINPTSSKRCEYHEHNDEIPKCNA